MAGILNAEVVGSAATLRAYNLVGAHHGNGIRITDTTTGKELSSEEVRTFDEWDCPLNLGSIWPRIWLIFCVWGLGAGGQQWVQHVRSDGAGLLPARARRAVSRHHHSDRSSAQPCLSKAALGSSRLLYPLSNSCMMAVVCVGPQERVGARGGCL